MTWPPPPDPSGIAAAFETVTGQPLHRPEDAQERTPPAPDIEVLINAREAASEGPGTEYDVDRAQHRHESHLLNRGDRR